MQLRVTKAHIKAIREPGGMELLAGGAHVGPIGGGPLHSLGDPHLCGREVAVEHGARSQRLGLPVAADIALLGRHAAEDGGLVLQVESVKH